MTPLMNLTLAAPWGLVLVITVVVIVALIRTFIP